MIITDFERGVRSPADFIQALAESGPKPKRRKRGIDLAVKRLGRQEVERRRSLVVEAAAAAGSCSLLAPQIGVNRSTVSRWAAGDVPVLDKYLDVVEQKARAAA